MASEPGLKEVNATLKIFSERGEGMDAGGGGGGGG